MENLLIVEDDLIQAHFLANSICRKLFNIRLFSIVTTGSEALEIIKKENVDIIILDLKLPDISGTEIIDFISKNNLSKYDSSVIVFTGEMEMLPNIIGHKSVFNYCSKVNGVENVVNQVKDLINNKKLESNINNVKKLIKNELDSLNFDFSYIGTKYLYECIYECFNKKNIYDINLKKEIYPIISKKYGKTITSIKTSIFQATSIMYYETDENNLSNYFGYRIISKPKTKDIIYIILHKIKHNGSFL